MREFSPRARRTYLERAAESVVDVLVVGGGITGCGVAREAALAGLSVFVVDKGDFASGTSSRSSKLIHGGVRYLAQGDLGLVREAARERAVLRVIAPHLARPVKMLIPTRSRSARLKLSAGLWTFDRLAADGEVKGHEVLDTRAVGDAEPTLRRDRLAGAVAYTEYVTDDARLTLETIKAAAQAGAGVANYAALEAIQIGDDGVRAVVDDRIGGEQLVVRARCLVNAAGPWCDRVHDLHDGGADKTLQLTRGIHLVFPRERLPVRHPVVFPAGDGRSTFVVPRGEYAYVGTTDTHYDGDPAEPGVSVADARYLLDAVASAFSEPPGVDDIIGTWSGVRPLLRQDGKEPSEISRRDEIRSGPGAVVTVAGGKLTTFRRMAERVTDSVLEKLGRAPGAHASSALQPLFGGSREQQERARAAGPRIADARLEDRLWSTYGLAAADILRRIEAQPALGERAGGLECLTLAEVDYAVEQEMVVSLDDLLRRRSSVAMFDIRSAVSASPAVARRLADHLGWDRGRERDEVERFSQDRERELATVRAVGELGRD